MLAADFPDAVTAQFTWRLTNTTGASLQRVDFRFVPGAVVTSPGEGGTYTAPSTRQYTADVVMSGGHEGIAFVAQGATGLPSGQSDVFVFTVQRADLSSNTVLWNSAVTTTAVTGRIDMSSDLCYTLPAPLTGADACYDLAESGQWRTQVEWLTLSASQLFHLDRLEPGGKVVRVTQQPLSGDANARVRFTELLAAGAATGYRIQEVSRAGDPLGQPRELGLDACEHFLGHDSSELAGVLTLLLALGGSFMLMRMRKRRGLS